MLERETNKAGAGSVILVDDDEGVCQSVSLLLKSVGIETTIYRSPLKFMESAIGDAGCILLDVRMPEMSGIEVQRRLNARGNETPVVFMTGHGEVAMAVRAMRSGAFDFLEKPVDDQILIDSVLEAIADDSDRRRRLTERASVESVLARLTRRERQVAELLADGATTRGVATALELSVRTVEGYRSRIMIKLEIDSLAQLVKLIQP
jgi:two-component system response regulator FixJ